MGAECESRGQLAGFSGCWGGLGRLAPKTLAAAALWGIGTLALCNPPPPRRPSDLPTPATSYTQCLRLLAVAEPVDLVLAVKEGDKVDWAQQYAGRARVIAYNKGQQPLGLSSISEVALPNVGREAHAYLHHIGECLSRTH